MLDRDTILQALSAMSDRLAQKGARGEVCLFGGAAMVVDAIFAPTALLRETADEIAGRFGLPLGWFNDGVKDGFRGST